ncbi:protein kinase superfamily protein [Actinidia rufa]|uniref:Protein kinase superfamily protein n=1 Tax=Actinidia rufa TaxID=165716 RepID=A0A7J0EYM1_9ERIC|nr:protein kinase superfamily protein [Actinidia rufa]
MDKYELVKDIGYVNIGLARLMRNKETKSSSNGSISIEATRVCLFFEPHSEVLGMALQIDENVAREIINWRSLRHPNITQFKEASFIPLPAAYFRSQLLSLHEDKYWEIKGHSWFLKNLAGELTEAAQAMYYRKENPSFSLQSMEDIMKIVEETKTPPPASRSIGGFGFGGEDDEEKEEEENGECEFQKRVENQPRTKIYLCKWRSENSAKD